VIKMSTANISGAPILNRFTNAIIEGVHCWTHKIVMDSNGDTRHEFDPSDLSSLATAEARFQELTGKGFRAVALGKNGAPGELIRKFDPRTEQTLFMPQLQGG
jgi:hypothetical protein